MYIIVTSHLAPKHMGQPSSIIFELTNNRPKIFSHDIPQPATKTLGLGHVLNHKAQAKCPEVNSMQPRGCQTDECRTQISGSQGRDLLRSPSRLARTSPHPNFLQKKARLESFPSFGKNTQRPDLRAFPYSPSSPLYNWTWTQTGTPNDHEDTCPNVRHWHQASTQLASPWAQSSPAVSSNPHHLGRPFRIVFMRSDKGWQSSRFRIAPSPHPPKKPTTSSQRPHILEEFEVLLTYVPVHVLYEDFLVSSSAESDLIAEKTQPAV